MAPERTQKYCDSYKHKLIEFKRKLFRELRIQEAIFGKTPGTGRDLNRRWCYNQISVFQGGFNEGDVCKVKIRA